MSNHNTKIIGGGMGKVKAICSCRRESNTLDHRGDAEQWIFDHLREVERIKVHLANRNPSLKDQRDWYLERENDPETSEVNRGLWRQMRQEIDRRLNEDHQTETEPLF